jgi:hypothetical protein
MRPTSLAKDLILKFLQDLFSEPKLYDGQNAYLWNLDPMQSKILIVDSYTEDLEKMELRPALVLRRGGTAWMNTSLNQRLSFDWRTGARGYTDLIHSDLTVECLSRNGLEAELLADLVFQGIQFFALQIRERGAFKVASVAIGSETLIQADSQQELTAVPVNMTLSFQSRWLVTPSQQLVEKIKGTINTMPPSPESPKTELQKFEVSAGKL